MSEQQKDVDKQHELSEGESDFPDLDNLTPEELKTMKKVFYKMFDADEEDEEKEEEKEKAPILCKPYLVTIEAIYHEYYSRTDSIIFRLATDEMGKVIKEPWSPHGSKFRRPIRFHGLWVRAPPPDRYERWNLGVCRGCYRI